MKYLCIEDAYGLNSTQFTHYFTKGKIYNQVKDKNKLVLVDNEGCKHGIISDDWLVKFILVKEYILPLGWYKLKSIV